MQVGFLNLLTIVFIVLKLTEVINWSWWLVLSPTIIGFAVIIVFIALTIWTSIK